MSFDFYLFDVNGGQCAATKLPNGKWCIFDAGKSADFSPVLHVRGLARTNPLALLAGLEQAPGLYKATISHLHGDHLADWVNLFNPHPTYFRTVNYDSEYLDDVVDSSSPDSISLIAGFRQCHQTGYGATAFVTDYGGASVREMGLAVQVARALGGSANSRVNNSSIVSRIDCYGNSILLCGDMETEAWDFVFTNSMDSAAWRELVSNVDVLVAPHHGHASGYSTTLMQLASPRVVLISVASKDPSVDSRYSSDSVSGLKIGDKCYRSITTRSIGGHISFSISPPTLGTTKGTRTWSI